MDETQPAAETGYTGGKTLFQRGPTKWYVYDGLGSVVGEVDPSGNLTSSPKYDVYGLVRSNAGTASSAMGFVGGLGHLSEAGTGLIYMKARYYDPSLGRFSSEDPSFDGSNWFIYCADNPTNKADANGREPLGVGGGILLMIAVAKYLAENLGWKPSERMEHFLLSVEGIALTKEIYDATLGGIAGADAAAQSGAKGEPYKSAEYIVAGNAAGCIVLAFAVEQLVLAITMADN